VLLSFQKAKNVELFIANKMFVDKEVAVKETFVKSLEKSFGATALGVDFNDRATIRMINKWVAAQTKNNIKNMIKPGGKVRSHGVSTSTKNSLIRKI
jgi:serine protease inhibitor